jgi:hypothetical protein
MALGKNRGLARATGFSCLLARTFQIALSFVVLALATFVY